jgi:hypothetical protein
MGRGGNARQHTRTWMTVVVPLLVVVLAAGGGATAKALNDRSGGSHAGHGRSVATTTTLGATAAASPTTKIHKPRHTTTTTTSPSTTSPSTTSPSTTTTPPTTAPGSDLDVKIPLPGFGDMLVDEARGRVYISGGKGTNAVDWYYVGTHDGVPTCPRDVAWAAGQLWFGWGCDNAPAGIGKVDPETRAYDLGMAHTDSRIVSAPLLATVPSQPNILIAGETGTNPALLFRFEATPTELHQLVMSRTDGGSVRQLAVTPDGGQVIVPSGAPYYHPALSTADLTEVHQYPTTAYPNAAAVRSDGLVAAGSNAAYDKDVFIFEPGGSTPIATYEFGHLPDQETWAHTLVDGGLARSGDRIYAVTHILSGPDNVTLRIRTLG